MSSTGTEIQVVNPYTGGKVGSVQSDTPDSVLAAVERARSAFDNDVLCAIERHDILLAVSSRLSEQREEFARLVCEETGKPIRESRLEVDRACTTLMWSAEECLRVDGVVQACDVTPQKLKRHAYAHRVPLGIVAAITPFNFPLNIPAHKAGPALAAGNAVIVKPSPKAPLATTRLVQLFTDAGLDPDMLQVCHGGADVVQALASAQVQVVSFTGSSFVGPQVAAWAAGKRVVMELGGNGAVVVMADADLDLAARTIVAHRFGSSGQRCTSCKRAIIHADVYGQMRDKIMELVQGLVVGDPAGEATDVGPLIDQAAADLVMEKLEAGRARGARVLTGGDRTGGIVSPTVVEDVPLDDALFLEETFGPVLPLVPFSTTDEAVSLVNATAFGLQAGVFTSDLPTMQELFRRLDVGAVIMNDGPGLRVEPIPFGGVKASGVGHEGIRYAVEEFSRLKTLVL